MVVSFVKWVIAVYLGVMMSRFMGASISFCLRVEILLASNKAQVDGEIRVE